VATDGGTSNSESRLSEEQIRQNATIEEVSQQNGPVPREQIEARYNGNLARGDSEEEALDVAEGEYEEGGEQ
jgi:hypothetical protein